MLMPPQLAPGMVAWVRDDRAGSVAPACILSTQQSVEWGAYTPVVRVSWAAGEPVPAGRGSCARRAQLAPGLLQA